MLNAWYHLSRNAAALAAGESFSIPDGDEDFVHTHVLDCRDVAGWKDLLRYRFGPKGNERFALAIEHADEVASCMGTLVLLLSHPFYAMGRRGKPLFLMGEAVLPAETLLKQGIVVDARIVGSSEALYWEAAGLAERYCRYCMKEFDAEHVFLTDCAGGGRAVREGLRMFQERAPVLFERTVALVRLMDERARLEAAWGLAGEENRILKELLELAGKSDEVNYILQFYKNEYEILPLWYKRFGHILKVVAGKRSFRSLFDKTAKKYRT